MNCPKCGHELDQTEQGDFCPNCDYVKLTTEQAVRVMERRMSRFDPDKPKIREEDIREFDWN